MTAPKTLYDKIWDDHVADEADDGTCLLDIDEHARLPWRFFGATKSVIGRL
jgi:homoaconitase/3-isopropylmalate dehydratase large subunit